MLDFASGELRIEVTVGAPGRLDVTWRGKSNDRQPGKALDPWFALLIAEAEEREAAARGWRE